MPYLGGFYSLPQYAETERRFDVITLTAARHR